MKIGKQERTWINEIESRKIETILDFLIRHGGLKSRDMQYNGYNGQSFRFVCETNELAVDALALLVRFYRLVSYLDELRVVDVIRHEAITQSAEFTLPDPNDAMHQSQETQQLSYFLLRNSQILRDRDQKWTIITEQYIPRMSLAGFIENGYRTDLQVENQRAKLRNTITIFVSIIALIVSAVTSYLNIASRYDAQSIRTETRCTR